MTYPSPISSTATPLFSFNSRGPSGTTSSSSFSAKQSWDDIPMPSIMAPKEPVINELTGEYKNVRKNMSTSALSKAMNALIGNTRAMSGQAASNASAAYTNRLMQYGINPIAGGVVGAQVRMAGNKEANNLAVQKEQMIQQNKKDATSIAAQVAANVASIREAYSRTLADYNKSQADLTQKAQMFNAQGDFEAKKFESSNALAEQELAARLAAIGGGTGTGTAKTGPATDIYQKNFTPGYIPGPGGAIIPGTGYNGANGHNVLVGWAA